MLAKSLANLGIPPRGQTPLPGAVAPSGGTAARSL